MNFIVTGSRGFIGRRVVESLCAAGHRVVAAAATSSNAAPPCGALFRRVATDDPAELLPEELHGEPFRLVHLAWDMKRPALYEPHARQVAWFGSLLDHWESRGLESVVVAGSADEFGQREGRISDDDEPMGILSAYGWGKRAARSLAESWSRRSEIPVLWIRPFLVYGSGQTGDMVVPYALNRALARERADFSEGLQERDFVYVDDVAEALTLAAVAKVEEFVELNIGTGTGARVRDVLNYIAELSDATDLFRFGARPRRKGEPKLSIADVQRAEHVLNWKPTTSWREGIRRMIETTRELRWTA